jgi:toxin CptA
MTSAPAIGFEYRHSRWAQRLFVAVTVLALLAVLLSGLPWWLKPVFSLGAMAACRQALRSLRLPVVAVGWSGRSGWSLHGRDGADEPAALLSHKVVRNAVLLRMASRRHGKLTLWLMPDNTDADTRRRLRMRLALLGGEQEEAA